MKTRFNTYDIICSVSELQRCIGMRVNQVYDIDNKTYLIRLQRSEEKCILLLESGNRFHTTAFEWPKNNAPSGFSMKMRKHLKNKRLEKLCQLGIDRVVDFQFGTGEAAYHIILELYDRGNIILTDYNWIILNVLRPHVEGEAVRFAVKEKYPLDRAKERAGPPSPEKLQELITAAKQGDNLKKILNPHVEYGPAVIDHVLSKVGLGGTHKPTTDPNAKGFYLERDLSKLVEAMEMADEMMTTASKNVSKGYIIQKKETRAKTKDNANDPGFLLTNQEFHPFLYAQYESSPYAEFDTFDRAVDEFFSTLEGQKIDIKALQIENEAMKKLQNVRKDHDKRLTELSKVQIMDRNKAELITRNQSLVDSAILAVQSAIANQLSWNEINELVKSAQANKDPIAMCIKQLKLQSNTISLALQDPYLSSENSDDDEEEKDNKKKDTGENMLKPMVVDVDLSLTAFANARRYFNQKRSAAKKQQKTIESQTKALKSAEKKTMQTLKEVQTITNINKARKVYWFEKFYWFISSENYLVIGGRDQQQNELLVKRYMRPTDIYVHADLSGASSIVIKNPTGEPVPPKTLNEAGQMAISYSIAWEAKVVTSAWWVHAPQVSKTAPTGEYITTGSFMIRGKKNFLPPCHLILGLTFMFRLEDGSIDRHLNERRVIQQDEASIAPSEETIEDEEIVLSADEGEGDDDEAEKETKTKTHLDSITEETEKIKLLDNQEDINSNSSSSDEDETGPKFPDTHIKVEHDTGKIIMRTNRTLSTNSADNEEREDVVFLGDDKPIAFPSLPQMKHKGKKATHQPQGGAKGSGKEEKENSVEKPGLKRRQKSKLKKIKEKYKDQDEEDRAFIMEMFKPDGAKKEPKKSGKKGSHGQTQQNKKKESFKGNQVKKESIEGQAQEAGTENKEHHESDDEGAEAEPEPAAVAAETDMLCQLTGQPLPEDELLFAVPVVAPYSALHNYKFKVKLTPGTGKRGKASKTAIAVFLRDKTCSPREKDLLKAVKDENLARNLPGKVKLSAPQLQKTKKK